MQPYSTEGPRMDIGNTLFFLFWGGNTSILKCIIFISPVGMLCFNWDKNHVIPYCIGSFHEQFKSDAKFVTRG